VIGSQPAVFYNPSPNHEYFAGREFDNFRHNFGGSIRPTGDFSAGVNGTIGGAIDFAGARKAEQVRLSPFVTESADRHAPDAPAVLAVSFQLQINPQTVLLAGYSGNQLGLPGGDLTIPRGRTDLTHTDRTFFLKIGYAWVL
jgi:hypothetical protein